MKEFKVIFDGEAIEGLNVIENNIDDAKAYVNILINDFESYGFNVEEV